MDMKEIYGRNKEFQLYVSKYCNQYKCDTDEALRHKLVQQVASYYEHKGQES